MILNQFSQAKLEHVIKTFTVNGQLPHVQEVLAPVGYDTETLQQMVTLLQSWQENKVKARNLLTFQKRATQVERKAQTAARKEVSQFKQAVRAIFGNDESVLRTLNLHRRRNGGSQETNGANGHDSHVNGSTGMLDTHTNGNSQAADQSARTTRGSQRTVDLISRWQQMFTDVQNLEEAQQERLARVGWTAGRIADAQALIDSVAVADIEQQEAIGAYRAQFVACKEMENKLRELYKEARAVARLAITQAGPEERAQLQETLAV